MKYVSVVYILGQNTTESHLHLMAMYIIIGFYIGVIYFYYHEVLNTKGITSPAYSIYPFKFCYILAGLFNKISTPVKCCLVAGASY